MLISRRSTLAYASAATVCAVNTLPASAQSLSPAPSSKTVQLVQHLVIHPDEVDGHAYSAPIAFAASNTAWKTAWMLDDSEYRAALAGYDRRGYGLRRVNAFQTRQGVRYAAIWQLGHHAPSRTRHDMTLGEYQAAARLAVRDGYAAVQIDACATTAGPRFAAIWEKSTAPAQETLAGLSAAQYERELATLTSRGFAPTHLAGYAIDGGARFAAVFTPGAQTEALHAIPAAEFHRRSSAMRSQGYRLRDANGYGAGGQPYYAAVWERA